MPRLECAEACLLLHLRVAAAFRILQRGGSLLSFGFMVAHARELRRAIPLNLHVPRLDPPPHALVQVSLDSLPPSSPRRRKVRFGATAPLAAQPLQTIASTHPCALFNIRKNEYVHGSIHGGRLPRRDDRGHGGRP